MNLNGRPSAVRANEREDKVRRLAAHAVACQAQGNLADAVAAYHDLVTLAPDFAEAWFNFGITLKALGRLEDAVGAYRRAVALRPGDAEAHCNLGNALGDLGKHQDALSAYRRAIAVAPDFADAHFNLGATLVDLGRAEEAVGALRQAVRCRPDWTVALCCLGQTLTIMGQIVEAIEVCRQGLVIAPDDVDLRSVLGMALAERDRSPSPGPVRAEAETVPDPMVTNREFERLIFQWGISPFFGWGVYGLNLALYGRGGDHALATACPLVPEWRMGVDAARQWLLRDFLGNSHRLALDLSRRQGRVDVPDALVLHALGSGLKPVARAANNTMLMGGRTVGIVFCEDTALDAEGLERGRGYERLVAGSRWNAELLRAGGLGRVDVVLQGIDPALFHPAPRSGLFEDRFTVFSGGKLERRKGQDLVLKAFRIFHQRHPEALLLAAWHSPWSKQIAQSMASLPGVAPVPVRMDGTIDVAGWVQANGIPAEAVIDLGPVPNALMPPLLREMDVALFPSRCEAGTNLVAMEAMACGVPVVLSANTGHLDLIGPDNSYPLRRQSPVEWPNGWGTEGWGESDPEEIVAALEAVYEDRSTARARGAAGAISLAKLSWQGQIGELLKVLG